MARESLEETAEREVEEAGNVRAENIFRSREEEKLVQADLESVRRMQDETMARLREQEQSPPDEGDPEVAKKWNDGPTAQGWVLERILDAVLDNDAGTISRLLAGLQSNDCNERVCIMSNAMLSFLIDLFAGGCTRSC